MDTKAEKHTCVDLLMLVNLSDTLYLKGFCGTLAIVWDFTLKK